MTSDEPVIRRHCRHPMWLPGMMLVLNLVVTTFAHQLIESTPAAAHFWYPKECCTDQDCFRASSIKRRPDGSLRVEAGHFSVIVPPDHPARPSQDNDAHVCVFRDIRGHYQVRCVFLPGMS